MFARSTRRQLQSPAVARCAPLHIWRVNATSVPRRQGIIHREIVNKWRQGCFLPPFGCILLFCFFGCRHTQVCAAAQQEQREQQRDTAVIPGLRNRRHCLRGGRGGRRRRRLRGGRCLHRNRGCRRSSRCRSSGLFCGRRGRGCRSICRQKLFLISAVF